MGILSISEIALLIHSYRLLSVRNGLGDRGSISGRIIPKTQKMVLDAALLNTQHYKYCSTNIITSLIIKGCYPWSTGGLISGSFFFTDSALGVFYSFSRSGGFVYLFNSIAAPIQLQNLINFQVFD